MSNLSKLLTTSCSHKDFMMISQTVQELSYWQTDTHTHTDPQTLLKTIPTLICYRCTGIDTCDRKTVPTIVEWIKNCRTHQYLPPTMEQHCLNRMKNSLQIYTNHSTTTNTRLQTRIDNNHDNTHEPVPERLVISGFLMARGGCQESPNLASHCMTASWACSSHTKKTQDLMPDAILTTTHPIYPGLGPAHSMLDCTLSGLVKNRMTELSEYQIHHVLLLSTAQ